VIEANIYDAKVLAGKLAYDGVNYIFTYDLDFLYSRDMTAISLTLPKQKEPFVSDTLHSFFSNLLAEGSLKDLQCKVLKIDKNDEFTRLLKTASVDTIGTITVEELG
jgi:serine/threonine-protein kinase HipA